MVAQIRTTSRPSKRGRRDPRAARGHHPAHQRAHVASAAGGTTSSTASGDSLATVQPSASEPLADARDHRDGAFDVRAEPCQPAAASARNSRSPRKRRDHWTLFRYGSTLATLDGMKLVRGVKGLGQQLRRARVMNMAQPMVVANHLCASMVIESARSMPAAGRAGDRMPAPRRPRRHRRDTRAAPAQAMSAQACSGSIMPAPVVPAVATTITGTRPRARSAAIAARERLGIHAPAAVGGDQPQRAAADAGLVRDLEPGDVTFARGVEAHRARRRRARRRARSAGERRSARRPARCSSPPSRRS